jgi:hypothetical protein
MRRMGQMACMFGALMNYAFCGIHAPRDLAK